MVTAILATKVAASLYTLLVEDNFVVWALLGVVLLVLFFLRNSITVHAVRPSISATCFTVTTELSGCMICVLSDVVVQCLHR